LRAKQGEIVFPEITNGHFAEELYGNLCAMSLFPRNLRVPRNKIQYCMRTLLNSKLYARSSHIPFRLEVLANLEKDMSELDASLTWL